MDTPEKSEPSSLSIIVLDEALQKFIAEEAYKRSLLERSRGLAVIGLNLSPREFSSIPE